MNWGTSIWGGHLHFMTFLVEMGLQKWFKVFPNHPLINGFSIINHPAIGVARCVATPILGMITLNYLLVIKHGNGNKTSGTGTKHLQQFIYSSMIFVSIKTFISFGDLPAMSDFRRASLLPIISIQST